MVTRNCCKVYFQWDNLGMAEKGPATATSAEGSGLSFRGIYAANEGSKGSVPHLLQAQHTLTYLWSISKRLSNAESSTTSTDIFYFHLFIYLFIYLNDISM